MICIVDTLGPLWRRAPPGPGTHRPVLALVARVPSAPTRRSVIGLYRQLADANPATYLPDLARGLWGFAWVRATVGLELPEALTAVKEAIAIYQRLTEETPEAFGGSLLSAHYALADVLDGLGRHDLSLIHI